MASLLPTRTEQARFAAMAWNPWASINPESIMARPGAPGTPAPARQANPFYYWPPQTYTYGPPPYFPYEPYPTYPYNSWPYHSWPYSPVCGAGPTRERRRSCFDAGLEGRFLGNPQPFTRRYGRTPVYNPAPQGAEHGLRMIRVLRTQPGINE